MDNSLKRELKKHCENNFILSEMKGFDDCCNNYKCIFNSVGFPFPANCFLYSKLHCLPKDCVIEDKPEFKTEWSNMDMENILEDQANKMRNEWNDYNLNLEDMKSYTKERLERLAKLYLQENGTTLHDKFKSEGGIAWDWYKRIMDISVDKQ